MDDASAYTRDLGEPLALHEDGSPAKLTVYRMPDLWLASGRVIAADMMVGGGAKPFARAVAPGRYPFLLVVVQLESSARIAFAIIRFSDARVTRWEPAVPEGEDAGSLKPGEAFAYPVDSGTGSFCDESAHQLFASFNDDDGGFLEELSEQLGRGGDAGNRWVHVETPAGSFAAFSSGYGDGSYPSWFGLDERGIPAQLVTDFNLVKWRESILE